MYNYMFGTLLLIMYTNQNIKLINNVKSNTYYINLYTTLLQQYTGD